jgi:hypothetical protein
MFQSLASSLTLANEGIIAAEAILSGRSTKQLLRAEVKMP